MLQQIQKSEEGAASMAKHLKLTKEVMDPINDALAMESEEWCQELQKTVAGPFADKINTISSEVPTPGELHAIAPKAKLNHDGLLDLTVVPLGVYEGNWPVPETTKLTSAAGPAVKRNTATSLGCRVVSRGRLASLLKEQPVEEPDNACEEMNVAAFNWALSHVAQRTKDRYTSGAPCNSCAPAVKATILHDVLVEDVKSLEDAGLDYTLDETALTVASSSFVSAQEYSCTLLSPARSVDFLMFDSLSASRFEAPSDLVV